MNIQLNISIQGFYIYKNNLVLSVLYLNKMNTLPEDVGRHQGYFRNG